MLLSFFIALRTAVALAYIPGDSGDISDSFGYALKTSSVGMRSFESIVSLIALTARLRHSSAEAFESSMRMILYARRSGS